jgi:hypothetical protein
MAQHGKISGQAEEKSQDETHQDTQKNTLLQKKLEIETR